MLYRRLYQCAVLGITNRWRLARGANDDDAVGALADVPVKQALQARQVKLTVVLHRGDYGGNGTLYRLHERVRN